MSGSYKTSAKEKNVNKLKKSNFFWFLSDAYLAIV